LIAGYAIPGLQRWSDKYLIDIMGDNPLSVAVTPNGSDSDNDMEYLEQYTHYLMLARYADAVTLSPDGKWYFAEPYYQRMTMRSLLSNLGSPSESLKQN
jgi:peptidyl-lysine (3S)-dioxygenase / protease